MNMIKALSAAALTFSAVTSFAAMTADVITERTQIAQSDLVFKGTVSNVSYAMSGEEGDKNRIPHTFVTYDIEQVLHGSTKDQQITLRFIGGRGKDARFLFVSGQPMFDIGDRDVLMVADNNISGCPLVNCANGRYRLLQGKVFSEAGQALEQNSRGELEKVGYYNLPEVMTHKVSQTTLRLVDQLDEGEERLQFIDAGKGAHIDEQQFVERLQAEARNLGKATPAEFVSANSKALFSIEVEAVAAPESRDEDAVASVKRSAQEQAEYAAMMRSGGSPVIGNYKDDATDGIK